VQTVLLMLDYNLDKNRLRKLTNSLKSMQKLDFEHFWSLTNTLMKTFTTSGLKAIKSLHPTH